MPISVPVSSCLSITGMALLLTAAIADAAPVKTTSGAVEGVTVAGSNVRVFKGIPFAAPPVGDLRWKPPQPPAPWHGVRKATEFGARCMQARVFDDMIFRDENSEDCLYLNVWTPAKGDTDRLPVMVWIYGGGFRAGSASEPRQDGERLAAKGVVVVGFNYRLGVFGFLSHPELTAESPNHASGNYGLQDQVAALRWVKDNIAAFGGDPGNVTIFGESAGSFSVSAMMATPLARGLFHRAIGESGAFFPAEPAGLGAQPLAVSEQTGVTFAKALGAESLAAMRAKPAEDVLNATKGGPMRRFGPNVDGSLFVKDPRETFANGEQSHVPLLAGWNADESRAGIVLSDPKPTAASFTAQTRTRFGDHADAILSVYPASTDDEAIESAAALGSDMFIGFSTWKWLEVHGQTGQSPVYRYSFDRKIPVAPDTKINGKPATAKDVGARHAGEIEYVFGQLDSVPKVTWDKSDRALSDQMMSYWSNFAKSGEPNGSGLPTWPRYEKSSGYQVMHLDETSKASPDATRKRYETIDAVSSKPKAPGSARY
jgi:para-nitrobenzyl esterase